MTETRLSVRVDGTTKKNAEAVFSALGMNLTTGINIFLTRVSQTRSIPFPLELDSDPQDMLMRGAVKSRVSKTLENGAPVALFDAEQNRPYLEYADGRRVYELD
jgi:addiction module RelB/DinJ family antitoxin